MHNLHKKEKRSLLVVFEYIFENSSTIDSEARLINDREKFIGFKVDFDEKMLI